jgi:hypothetical protein
MCDCTCSRLRDRRLRQFVVGENQKLLLKIEELFMSAVKPIIDSLSAKIDTLLARNAELATSNVALTEQAVLKDQALAAKDAVLTTAQGDLLAAVARAVDPAEVAQLEAIVQKLVDAIG